LAQSSYHGLLDLFQEKGWLGWPLWAGATAVMAAISQNRSH